MEAASFSIYSNTYDIHSAGELTMQDVYELVALKKKLSDCPVEHWRSQDSWPWQVQRFRETKNKFIKERAIPAVIFFATTSANDRKAIKTPSGYFGIDLDYADNKVTFDTYSPSAVKQLVADKFPSVCLMFVSPSGRGLKVAHKINPVGANVSDYAHVSRRAFEHFNSSYADIGLVIDSKCKDWNRLCYLSYDREAYYNTTATPENIAIPEPIVIPVPVLANSENGYQLSHDRRDKDQICPHCTGGQHRDKSFTYYVDECGNRLEGCGVCSRSKCSANIKPWEHYPNVRWKYLGRMSHI